MQNVTSLLFACPCFLFIMTRTINNGNILRSLSVMVLAQTTALISKMLLEFLLPDQHS